MCYKLLIDNINKLIFLREDLKIIYIYRYISLLVTSLFYVISNNTSSFTMKLFMIFCLTISSAIFNYMYRISEHLGRIRILFIIIEVIGNILILIPTGGIDSPYIWYSLNSILITTYFYNIYASFFMLIMYQIVSSVISRLIFLGNRQSILQLLSEHSNLLLSFILIIIAAQLLINQAKKLNVRTKELSLLNNQLSIANDGLKNSMEQIVKLYQAVHSFTSLDNKDKLVNLLINYTMEITKSTLVVLCTLSKDKIWSMRTSRDISIQYKQVIANSLRDRSNEIKIIDIPILITVSGENFMVAPLNSSTKFYGILAVKLTENEDNVVYKETMDQMRFLSSLSSIAFEKFDLEVLKREFLINEEQNRIANEIHDSVSQRLFAISCSVFGVVRKTKNIVSEEISHELNNINYALNDTIKELRETIYGMSWNKQGVSVFQMNIKKYIDDISKFYGTNISFNMSGSEELTNSVLKRALYRIICEGVGNSARHGRSKYINVSLNIERNLIKLVITDDGIGFDKNNIKDDIGLGIKNINNLIYSLEGSVEINTSVGNGTTINISLPNNVSNNGVKIIV